MRSRVASGDAYDWNDPSGGGSAESLALKYESPRTPSGAAPRTWRKPAVPPPVAYRLGLHAVAVVACAVVTQHWYALAPLGIHLLSQHRSTAAISAAQVSADGSSHMYGTTFPGSAAGSGTAQRYGHRSVEVSMSLQKPSCHSLSVVSPMT